jgi:hypothetical protein
LGISNLSKGRICKRVYPNASSYPLESHLLNFKLSCTQLFYLSLVFSHT